jgi:hypothetical protein
MKNRVILVLGLVLVLGLSMIASAAAEEPIICGEAQVSPLTAGQFIPVGTVTVSNDEDNLYVTYQTTGDWYLKETQLHVLDYAPMERLPPGQAPYKDENVPPYPTSHTFVVPLSGLGFEVGCGETDLWLQAHATVVKIVGGEEVQSETAYGGDIGGDGGAWYGNIMYTVQCCNGGEPCYEFMGETAWADGDRYVTRGNWATYTPYVADSTVTLYAGQYYEAGTVHFSAVDGGKVTITINLTGDWEFAPEDENVKIQDYAYAPSGNPSPGGFDHKGTASGQSFSIEVPANSFYGVHVDVGYWVEVPCE